MLRTCRLLAAVAALAFRVSLRSRGFAACCLSALTMVVIVSMGINMVSHPIPMLVNSAAGLTCAAGWYLPFLALPSYLRFVEGRGARRRLIPDQERSHSRQPLFSRIGSM